MTPIEKREARDALVALIPGVHHFLKREGVLAIKNVMGCSEEQAAELLNGLRAEGVITLQVMPQGGETGDDIPPAHFRWGRGAKHI
jgi:hypothetical protein